MTERTMQAGGQFDELENIRQLAEEFIDKQGWVNPPTDLEDLVLALEDYREQHN